MVSNTTPPEDNPGAPSCNVICAFLKDADSNVPTLTDLEPVATALANQTEVPLVLRT